MEQVYAGPKESWDEIFDVVNAYLTSPKVSQKEKNEVAAHMKKITPYQQPPVPSTPIPPLSPSSPSLMLHQLRIGDRMKFKANQKSVANVECIVRSKGRTKVVVELLQDATNHWKAGTEVRTSPSSLERIVP